MKLRDILPAVQSIAPESLAESWDKVGLQVGRLERDVKRALVCVDLTKQVMAEAVARQCQMIVAYHPPIFSPVNELTEKHWKGRVLLRAAEEGIAIYSPHTALDAVRGGMCDWLCDVLGEGRSRPIVTRGGKVEEFYKVVVFVPASEARALRQAMAEAGAGRLGDYQSCSFEASGTGRFEPLEGASPAVGSIGVDTEVVELRLEMICAVTDLSAVLEAMRAAHSYETPAFDVIQLVSPPQDLWAAHGAGRILELDRLASPDELANRLQAALGVPIKLAYGDCDAIRTVAVCPGAGGGLFDAMRERADAYVTGEMRHHDVLELSQRRGRCVLLAGHTHTERPLLPNYISLLKEAVPAVEWVQSEKDEAPYHWFTGH